MTTDEGWPLAVAWLTYLVFLSVLAHRLLWRRR